ncbi:MAG: glutamine-hydrolyzing carbamoyl-phosphate synthase small subunit [Terrisporobacter othiniensis]|uniref:glutamine-hydrolyzing carbamoyl-phosphate synthase small subunit n=1 Tax=Terrisporobacter othiniensis TaxID=1577792 RepID=UPI002A755B41|nr:glutamine-hydrolyzing carbamoyl-phosphate synthase small subunit [Terrisporobacter othiniensis]MDY3374644.1 glutamine-hydrolyzing carbamoyl-phosphate synthase small subunit [Terrisporobacter othiniensis]
MNAKLILEDGTIFEGKAFGYLEDSVGEVVFNTSMTGYGEVLTDPSYYGQIVTMTYPLIGNYGINLEDVQSKMVAVKGFIVREKSDAPNNFRCEMSLDVYLKQNKIIGLEGIDTRALTKILRNNGTMKGIITIDKNAELEAVKHKLEVFDNSQAVMTVSRKKVEYVKGNGPKVAIMDYGVKQNIIDNFAERGCDITIFPALTPADEVLSTDPDLIFLSNGPGDPDDLEEIVNNAKQMVGKKPVVGICLGHQILGKVFGGKTSKLKFGHRGGNHPVKDLEEDRVFITAQNHGYYVSEVPESMNVTQINLNDNTVEGMRHKELPVYSVQYHPEACPGPKDSTYVFDKFLELL